MVVASARETLCSNLLVTKREFGVARVGLKALRACKNEFAPIRNMSVVGFSLPFQT